MRFYLEIYEESTMWFSIITIVIAVTFITWGVFAAVVPVQARHVADLMVLKLLKRRTGKRVNPDLFTERIELYKEHPTLYAQQYRSEVRSTRLGGLSVAIASGLALLWSLGVIR